MTYHTENPYGVVCALSDLSFARNHLVVCALDWLHLVSFNPQEDADAAAADYAVDYALRTAAIAYESALNALNEYKSPT